MLRPVKADHIGGVRPVEPPDTAHLAVGLWIATLAVLALPSLSDQPHRVREEHLIKAYSVATATFGLL